MSGQILAHRGNIVGPDAAHENSVPSVQVALARGWGLEIDIRRAPDGRFYISHDSLTDPSGHWADGYCGLLRRYPHATVALNIKELGDEAALLQYLDEQRVLAQCFLFDMELLESRAGDTARRLRALHPTVRIAARVSDRGESIERALEVGEASVIWLDEFDGPWSTEADVRRLRAAGHAIYAVSPDLHAFAFKRAQARWHDFLAWGVDGICTDYPADLALRMAGSHQGAMA